MIPPDISHSVAFALYVYVMFWIRRGLTDSTAWFSIFFLLLFSQNVFGYFLGRFGYEDFVSIVESQSIAVHGEILLFSMLVGIATHMLSRRGMKRHAILKSPPLLAISSDSLYVVYMICSAFGIFIATTLCLFGYMGYFTRPEILSTPPRWLDIALQGVTFSSALLLLLFLVEFNNNNRPSIHVLGLTAAWSLTGFLSGFKNLVIRPFLMLTLCTWMLKKSSVRFVLLSIAAIFLAYSVVEPLRAAKNRNGTLTVNAALNEIFYEGEFRLMDPSDWLSRLVSRVDISVVGVKTLDRFEEGGLPLYTYRLKEYFDLWPAMAFAPRFIWEDKPVANIGTVLYYELTGNKTTSVTPSVIVTSFIWGGYTGLTVCIASWAFLCTAGGELVLASLANPLRGTFTIILGLVLSLPVDIMASYYINVVRIIAGIMLLCMLRILVYEKVPAGHPSQQQQGKEDSLAYSTSIN